MVNGLVYIFGVIESHFYIHVSEIAAMVTLLDAELFTVRMADYIEPGLVVEAGRLHHQRVASPMPSGVAEPGGLHDLFGKPATVGVDLGMLHGTLLFWTTEMSAVGLTTLRNKRCHKMAGNVSNLRNTSASTASISPAMLLSYEAEQ
jgi:hypothetical protein